MAFVLPGIEVRVLDSSQDTMPIIRHSATVVSMEGIFGSVELLNPVMTIESNGSLPSWPSMRIMVAPERLLESMSTV